MGTSRKQRAKSEGTLLEGVKLILKELQDDVSLIKCSMSELKDVHMQAQQWGPFAEYFDHTGWSGIAPWDSEMAWSYIGFGPLEEKYSKSGLPTSDGKDGDDAPVPVDSIVHSRSEILSYRDLFASAPQPDELLGFSTSLLDYGVSSGAEFETPASSNLHGSFAHLNDIVAEAHSVSETQQPASGTNVKEKFSFARLDRIDEEVDSRISGNDLDAENCTSPMLGERLEVLFDALEIEKLSENIFKIIYDGFHPKLSTLLSPLLTDAAAARVFYRQLSNGRDDEAVAFLLDGCADMVVEIASDEVAKLSITGNMRRSIIDSIKKKARNDEIFIRSFLGHMRDQYDIDDSCPFGLSGTEALDKLF